MPDPSADYAKDDLRQAAAQARAYAEAARALVDFHRAHAAHVMGEKRHVALAMMEAHKLMATHADKLTLLYEREFASCP